MNKEDEITKNLSLIEYYKEQLNALDLQSQYIQAAFADYYKSKMTIEQLHKADVNSEILIPIGGGTYINGSIKDASKVLVDIGAGLVTEKSVDNALKKIDERIKNLQEKQEKLMETAQKLQAESAEISEKTQKLMEETQK
jgi:prefoldin alpha subunit